MQLSPYGLKIAMTFVTIAKSSFEFSIPVKIWNLKLGTYLFRDFQNELTPK